MNPSKLLIILGLGVCISAAVNGQQIQLYFPQFGGQAYVWTQYRGQQKDTLATGALGKDGRATLIVPDWLKGTQTITQWSLLTGGGLDLILFGKDYSVQSTSATPNEDNIFYTGNPENDFLTRYFLQRDSVLQQAQTLQSTLHTLPKNDALAVSIQQRLTSLTQKYAAMQQQLHQNPLYAARFTEIADLTRDIGDSLSFVNPESSTKTVIDFVNNRLNLRYLFTSGHWSQVWYIFIQAQAASSTTDSLLTRQLISLLIRQQDVLMRNAFVDALLTPLEQNGYDATIGAIGKTLQSNYTHWNALPEENQKRLLAYMIPIGAKAPDLHLVKVNGKEAVRFLSNITLKTNELNAPYSLVFFYNSSCTPCEDAFINILNRYEELKKKGVRIISISSDKTIEEFSKKESWQPWPDVYCDMQGMTGINFVNYGVLGTPTFFVLDSAGTIISRQATSEAVLKWFGIAQH